MKRNSMIIIVIFTLIISALTFASDKDIVKIQGIIMEVDLKRNMMILNEKRFVWDPKTIVCDERGASMTMDKLKTNHWVYIEGVDDKVNKRIIAKKIYLLPKNVGSKKKQP